MFVLLIRFDQVIPVLLAFAVLDLVSSVPSKRQAGKNVSKMTVTNFASSRTLNLNSINP